MDIFEARQLSSSCGCAATSQMPAMPTALRRQAVLQLRWSPGCSTGLECQSLLARLKIRRFIIRRSNRLCLLCRQLEQFGGRVRVHVRSKQLHKAVETEIRKLFGTKPSPLTTDLRRLLDRFDGLIKEENEVNRDCKDRALASDICRRLMEIPGIGPICALTFTAAIDDPRSLQEAVTVGSYLGLTPRLHQSGLSSKTGRISRMGNREVRHLLVQASIQFMRSTSPDDHLHAWTETVARRRGRGTPHCTRKEACDHHGRDLEEGRRLPATTCRSMH